MLSRLLFGKPLADLTPAERAEFELFRALDSDAADEDRYHQRADFIDPEKLKLPLLDAQDGRTGVIEVSDS